MSWWSRVVGGVLPVDGVVAGVTGPDGRDGPHSLASSGDAHIGRDPSEKPLRSSRVQIPTESDCACVAYLPGALLQERLLRGCVIPVSLGLPTVALGLLRVDCVPRPRRFTAFHLV